VAAAAYRVGNVRTLGSHSATPSGATPRPFCATTTTPRNSTLRCVSSFNSVDDSTRRKLDAGALPRGGYGATVGITSNSDNQQAGASFRMVADLSDWEKTMFTNTPGQSGNPESPYYKNLFNAWANDQHFLVYFNRAKVERSAREKIVLNPR